MTERLPEDRLRMFERGVKSSPDDCSDFQSLMQFLGEACKEIRWQQARNKALHEALRRVQVPCDPSMGPQRCYECLPQDYSHMTYAEEMRLCGLWLAGQPEFHASGCLAASDDETGKEVG